MPLNIFNKRRNSQGLLMEEETIPKSRSFTVLTDLPKIDTLTSQGPFQSASQRKSRRFSTGSNSSIVESPVALQTGKFQDKSDVSEASHGSHASQRTSNTEQTWTTGSIPGSAPNSAVGSRYSHIEEYAISLPSEPASAVSASGESDVLKNALLMMQQDPMMLVDGDDDGDLDDDDDDAQHYRSRKYQSLNGGDASLGDLSPPKAVASRRDVPSLPAPGRSVKPPSPSNKPKRRASQLLFKDDDYPANNSHDMEDIDLTIDSIEYPEHQEMFPGPARLPILRREESAFDIVKQRRESKLMTKQMFDDYKKAVDRVSANTATEKSSDELQTNDDDDDDRIDGGDDDKANRSNTWSNRIFNSIDGDPDLDDQSDDENLKRKQNLKLRQKQDAHLAVHRMRMIKLTGNNQTESNLAALANSQSMVSLSTVPLKGDGFDDDDNDDDEDPDDDIPLAALIMHGFPNINKKPPAPSNSQLEDLADKRSLRSTRSVPDRAGFLSSGSRPALPQIFNQHKPVARGLIGEVAARQEARQLQKKFHVMNSSSGYLVDEIDESEAARERRKSAGFGYETMHNKLSTDSLPRSGYAGSTYGNQANGSTAEIQQQLNAMMQMQMQMMMQMNGNAMPGGIQNVNQPMPISRTASPFMMPGAPRHSRNWSSVDHTATPGQFQFPNRPMSSASSVRSAMSVDGRAYSNHHQKMLSADDVPRSFGPRPGTLPALAPPAPRTQSSSPMQNVVAAEDLAASDDDDDDDDDDEHWQQMFEKRQQLREQWKQKSVAA